MHKINLCGNSECTQCFACQQACPKNCIRPVETEAGFHIPQIDRQACIECGACMKVCHKLNGPELSKPQKAYVAWTTVEQDRRKSSSGGAFSVLARMVLDDGGVVYGATMDAELKVRHIPIEKVSDIPLLQGSKYVQSDLGDTFVQIRENLKLNRKVLFTGTPCQVAALYAYLKSDSPLLLTCDVVCHGVPSQKAFDIYTDRNGLRKNTREIVFRFTEGWGFRMRRKTGDGKFRVIMPRRAYYLRAFSKGLMFAEACYSCPYAREERGSDITIADYWGIGTMAPFKHSVKGGLSMVLATTEKGIRAIEKAKNLYVEERPMQEAVQGNHNLQAPSRRPKGRDSYYEESRQEDLKNLERKYNLAPSVRDYLRLVKQYIVKYL